eukprot:TRINITY_DN6674_c0_g1_i3.p1 TRINITY_DN6674_c0_g1~~TRINITY_DN6674_c0_g1_i3.p1  ORF type:complete len:725 (-),score=143.95 TRINITY_DN6674_c0_g1_i3:489-2663(-)
MEACNLLLFIVFAMGMALSDGTTDQSDVSALQNLYKSLNNPQQLTGWNTNGGVDPCAQSWKGVTCSGSAVTSLQLSGLGLTGTLYYELSSFPSLKILDLSNNAITGNIPYSLPQNLQEFNLASNQLSGNIPYSISGMTNLTKLNFNHNQLSGQIQDVFNNHEALSKIDFSFNNLSQNLPRSFKSLTSLSVLYLQNNQLTGPVDVLADLPLTELNIENNHFSGWIPNQWKSHSNFLYSGNNFTMSSAPPPPPYTPPPPSPPKRGRTPPSGSTATPTTSEEKDDDKDNKPLSSGAIAGIVCAVIVAVSAVILAIICARKPRREDDMEKIGSGTYFTPIGDEKTRSSYSSHASSTPKGIEQSTEIKYKPVASEPYKTPPSDWSKAMNDTGFADDYAVVKNKQPITVKAFSVAELQMATNSFSQDNLVGEGALGNVYRADLVDGKVLAIKKLDTSILPIRKRENFTEAVSLMSNLHHPYITELVGYCAEHGQCLLVYEYFDNGSLYDMLHLMVESIKPLSWNLRVKIALGTARALEYLHEVCSPSIVHKNFKSANILLDDDLNPHLADCGLSSLNPDFDRQVATQVVDSYGYSAPEYTMKGIYTLKSDVYSFGVVMLELLTGRKPLDSSRPRSEQSLVRWATPQLHDIDALTRMVDPVLKEVYPAKSLSRFADVIVKCIQPEPEFRPPMSEVVQDLMRMIQKTSLNKRMVVDELGDSYRAPDQDYSNY